MNLDIDECVEETDDCNRKSQICLNMQGSFFCQNKASKTTCPPGYKIVPDEGCVGNFQTLFFFFIWSSQKKLKIIFKTSTNALKTLTYVLRTVFV